MSDDLDLDAPDRFTVATEGPVGERLFMLQCRQGGRRLTVKIEKQQVAVLASYLARIVRELGRPGDLPEDLEFEDVASPDWTVGTIGVSYDEETERVVVVLEELAPDDEDEEEEEESDVTEATVARVSLTQEQAAAFAIRATGLVEAGRPSCPLCGLPLDPDGHICPRTNGHRPPSV